MSPNESCCHFSSRWGIQKLDSTYMLDGHAKHFLAAVGLAGSWPFGRPFRFGKRHQIRPARAVEDAHKMRAGCFVACPFCILGESTYEACRPNYETRCYTGCGMQRARAITKLIVYGYIITPGRRHCCFCCFC